MGKKNISFCFPPITHTTTTKKVKEKVSVPFQKRKKQKLEASSKAIIFTTLTNEKKKTENFKSKKKFLFSIPKTIEYESGSSNRISFCLQKKKMNFPFDNSFVFECVRLKLNKFSLNNHFMCAIHF